MALLRKKKQSAWTSATDNTRKTGIAGLRAEFEQSAGAVWQPARAVFSESSGITAKLISLGELISDASVTPAGRVVTATVALTGAWWLL